MPDDHSEVVPLLPISNRKVKRFCADDSADSRVKVGHCQAIKPETPSRTTGRFFCPKFHPPVVSRFLFSGWCLNHSMTFHIRCCSASKNPYI